MSLFGKCRENNKHWKDGAWLYKWRAPKKMSETHLRSTLAIETACLKAVGYFDHKKKCRLWGVIRSVKTQPCYVICADFPQFLGYFCKISSRKTLSSLVWKSNQASRRGIVRPPPAHWQGTYSKCIREACEASWSLVWWLSQRQRADKLL